NTRSLPVCGGRLVVCIGNRNRGQESFQIPATLRLIISTVEHRTTYRYLCRTDHRTPAHIAKTIAAINSHNREDNRITTPLKPASNPAVSASIARHTPIDPAVIMGSAANESSASWRIKVSAIVRRNQTPERITA